MTLFRLDGISIQQVENVFTQILLPLDIIAIILLTIVFTISKCYRVYEEFPGTLFLWLLPLDAIFGLVVGPLRWSKGSVFFAALGDVRTMSDAACRWAAFIDTFFQMGSLYLNTCIVATVFYMVFYTSSLHGDAAVRARNLAAIGFFCFTLPVAIATIFAVPYRGVGFCMCDGIVLVIKQTIWYTAILCQVAMVIPTQYQIYVSSRISMKSISRGTYIRFCGIIFTQVIGLFPIMLIEAYGLTRRPVPKGLIYFMAVGFPVGHIIDAFLMSLKALPELFPLLARLFSGWEASKDKEKKNSSKDKEKKNSKKNSEGSHGSDGQSLDTKKKRSKKASSAKRSKQSNHSKPSKPETLSFVGGPISFAESGAALASLPETESLELKTRDRDISQYVASPRAKSASAAPRFLPSKPKKPAVTEAPLMRLRRYHGTKGVFLGKIVCTLMLPVLVIIGFCSYQLGVDSAELYASRLLQSDLQLAPLVTSYAHDLEVEQTAAILVTESGGQSFELIMRAQMETMNGAQQEFLDYTKSYNGRIRNDNLDFLMNPAVFNQERQLLFDGSLTNSSELLNEYNVIGSALFEALSDIAVAARTTTVVSRVYAFITAAEYKMKLGAERNMIPQLFRVQANLTVDHDTYVKYMNIRSIQNTWFELFSSFASAQAFEWRTETFGKNYELITAFHQALDARNFSVLNETTEIQHFTTLENYMLDLHKLQVHLAADVVDYSESLVRSKFGQVLGFLWLLVLTLFATIVLMYISGSTLRVFGNDIAFLQRHNGVTKKDSGSSEGSGVWSILRSRVQLPFVWQILAVLIIPVTCVCVVLLLDIGELVTDSVSTSDVRSSLDFLQAVSDAIDNVGLESAETVKYLSNVTDYYWERLLARRHLTDAALNILYAEASASFANTAFTSTPQFQAMFSVLPSLIAYRAQFNASVDPLENQDYFDRTKDDIAASLRAICANLNSDGIDHKMLIMLGTSNAKRSGGLVRDQGAAISQRGYFASDEDFSGYLSNLGNARNWMKIVTEYATTAENIYLSAFTHAPIAESFPVWEDLLTTDNTTCIADVHFSEWFYVRTRGDELLEGCRSLLAADIVNFANAAVASWHNKTLLHTLVLVFGSFLSIVMSLRSIFKIKGFSKLIDKYLEKEEKRQDMWTSSTNTQKSSSDRKTDDEGTSTHKRPKARSGSMVELRGAELAAISKMLLADFRLDASPASPDGQNSHHQAMLKFFSWISTTEGLVSCNKILFSKSRPGEGVQSLEFWVQLGELQTLAAQTRTHVTSLRKAEIGEQLYEKAEHIYVTFVKGHIDLESIPLPSSTRDHHRAKSVIGHLPSPRSHSNTKSESRDSTGEGLLHARTAYLAENRSRYPSSSQNPDVSLESDSNNPSTTWKPNRATSGESLGTSPARGRFTFSMKLLGEQQQQQQQQQQSQQQQQHRRFSLTDVLDDPRQLELFKKYCVQTQCMEVYEFLVAVRKFKRMCTSLPSDPVESLLDATQPGVAIQEAKTIFALFLSANAPRKINVSSGKYHEIEGRFSELPEEQSLPVALQLEGVFDSCYNEVRRLMVHNILGNVLTGGV